MRFLWVLLAMVFGFTASAAPTVVRGNHIAAIVNDTIITREAVRASTQKTMEILWQTFRDQPDKLRERQLTVYDEGLKSLIDRELILQDFLSSGGKLPESVIDEQVNDRIRRNFGDRATLTRTLQAQGMTTEGFRKQLRDDIIVSFMSRQYITSAILISPAKIERYYQEHETDFQKGEEAKLRMIVMGQARGVRLDEIRELALKVRGKALAGESFGELAGIYSEGSQSGENGDWGWVERDKLNKGLSDLAFSLKAKETSAVVGMARTTGFYWVYEYDDKGKLTKGRKYTELDKFVEEQEFSAKIALPPPVDPQEFYLMHIEDRRPARTLPLDEVRDQIERDLTAKEKERLRSKWIDGLRKKSFVRYF